MRSAVSDDGHPGERPLCHRRRLQLLTSEYLNRIPAQGNIRPPQRSHFSLFRINTAAEARPRRLRIVTETEDREEKKLRRPTRSTRTHTKKIDHAAKVTTKARSSCLFFPIPRAQRSALSRSDSDGAKLGTLPLAAKRTHSPSRRKKQTKKVVPINLRELIRGAILGGRRANSTTREWSGPT